MIIYSHRNCVDQSSNSNLWRIGFLCFSIISIHCYIILNSTTQTLKMTDERSSSSILWNRFPEDRAWQTFIYHLKISSGFHTSKIYISRTLYFSVLGTITIRMSSLSAQYAKWGTLIGFRAVRYVFLTRTSWFEDKVKCGYLLRITKNNKLVTMKLNLLNNDFKPKTKWIDTEYLKHVVTD